MKKLLMCWPDHFDVTYDINHWMHDQKGRVDKDLAKQQWHSLVHALSKVSVIEFINGVRNLPDLVFTANAGLIDGNKAVLSRFSTKERQPEEPLFGSWFEDWGYEMFQPVSNYEGEGDHLRDAKGRHWMGYGFRSELSAVGELENFLDKEIKALNLVDPRWYHLDTAFCPLPYGEVMWYPGAFSPAAQHLIRQTFARSLEVSEQDALAFSCNCVCIGDHLFMPQGSEVANKLRDLNYIVWEGDLSEFMKAGGAAKCLVLDCNFKPYRK